MARGTKISGSILSVGLCALMMAACLSTAALASGKPVDFSGTWVLDKSKSDMGRGGHGGRMGGRGMGNPGEQPSDRSSGGAQGEGMPGGRGMRNMDQTLVIHQSDTSLQIERQFTGNGDTHSMTQVYDLTGKPSTNQMGRGSFSTTSTWKNETLVSEGTQSMSTQSGNFDMKVKEEMSLSKDGKELTIKTTRSTPRGDRTSKLVFVKQAS